MEDDLTSTLMVQLFDVTSDAVIVIDARQTIVRFNRGAELMFGYDRAAVLGSSLSELLPQRFAHVHQSHVDQFGTAAENARTMGERRSISGRRANGSEFPATAGISKLLHGDAQYFAVILRDVTEQRKIEEEARALSTKTAIAAERSRLARDLHDAVTQSLFSASIMADVLPRIWDADPEKGKQQLHDIRLLTRSALAEMRTLLLELRPSAITDAKLADLIVQLAEAIRCRSGVNIEVTTEEQLHLPAEVQVAFYRIAQEALHNIVKHSKARNVHVQLSVLQRDAMLLIHDDGRGFDYQGIGETHLGLRIIHERAEAVNAMVSIESALGKGTDVLVTWRER
jgi:PAS domain S-box-containing protein